MSATIDIIVRLSNQASPEVKQLSGDLRQLDQDAKTSGTALEGTSAKSRLLGVASGVAVAGITALGAGLAFSIKQAIDAEDTQAQLNAVLESTGYAANLSADEINAMAGALQQQTKFGDEAIVQAQSLLLTFTNIGRDVFPQATMTLLDMATALGTDASGSAIQLGKALNDPIAGITALTRVGVTFTNEQKEQIRVLQQSGDIVGAQTIILNELAKEFGGSASAAAQTFSGRMAQVNNAVGDTGEVIGMALIPVLTLLAEAALPAVQRNLENVAARMEDMEGSTNALSGSNAQAVEEIVSDNLAHANSIEDLIVEYEKIERQMNMWGGVAAAVTGTSGALAAGQDEVTAAIARESATLEDFLATMQQVDPQIGLAIEARNRELIVLYEHEQVMQAALELQREEERVRDAQTAALERMREAQLAAAAAERDAYEQTPGYISQQEQLNEQMARYAYQLANGETVVAAFEAKQLELAVAHDEATAAAQRAETQLGNYFDAALTATGQADSFEMQLYESGAAAGLGAEQLRILAGATGEYTEAEIEAAFQAALMKANIDELVASVQAGTITAGEAVVALGALKSGQEETAAGAIGLASEMSAGAAALAEIRDRANEATAAVNSVPTSHNVHYTSSGSVDPPGSIPGGGNAPGQPPQAFQTGGWTGDYGGIVHPNELVIPTDVVRSGAAGILGFAQQHVPGGVSGGSGITIQIDARGSVNATAVEDAGYRGAKRALQEAGVRADIIRRAR